MTPITATLPFPDATAAFERLDLRVGRIIEAAAFPDARRPSHRLRIDLGELGTRVSVAGLALSYPDPRQLEGRLVIAAVNLPPRRVAGTRSDVLVLAALLDEGRVALLGVDAGARPGDRVA
jgi:tRNA-binding protein